MHLQRAQRGRQRGAAGRAEHAGGAYRRGKCRSIIREALIKSTCRLGEQILRLSKSQNRRSTLCISRFWGKDRRCRPHKELATDISPREYAESNLPPRCAQRFIQRFLRNNVSNVTPFSEKPKNMEKQKPHKRLNFDVCAGLLRGGTKRGVNEHSA